MRRGLWTLALCSFGVLGSEKDWSGSEACGKCHQKIYKEYSVTPMASTSGLANSIAIDPGSFSGNSGYKYSIGHQDGKVFLDFQKALAKERRELPYFVGSGAAARSFLIGVDNFLYEAPATFYSRGHGWDLSPGYERYSYPFLTRAIAPGCLECHATQVRAVAGTQNGFRSPPFRESGVGCERCHGPGARHSASGKPGDIVNPASLAVAERDSVCAQCHLSGEIRVDRAGESMSRFVAGERLSDYAVAFVREGAGRKVTSHVESLAQSACARASEGRLWCGTCHDPHSVPAAADKAAWYRSKCETCHAASVCGRGDNCIACHMPAGSVTDAQHVVYTDHSIPRRTAGRTNQRVTADSPLTAFGGVAVDARDLGLAYAIVGLREQNPVYGQRAFYLLGEALRHSPNEPQSLAYLADIYKTRYDDAAAANLYQKLYSVDPTQSSAPANLGAYQMEQGHYADAIRLFQEALQISPALVLVRLNLAMALVHEGRAAEARRILLKALEFSPSFTAARDLLTRIQ